MCRNQSEVTTILNNCGFGNDDTQEELDKHSFEEGIPNLARLRLAVNYNQKQASFFSGHDSYLNADSVIMLYTFTCLGKIHVCICTVCSPPNLPAGPFLHLVWKHIWLERQQDSMETPGGCGDLYNHAFPLLHLLDCTQVKGLCGLVSFCALIYFLWAYINLLKYWAHKCIISLNMCQIIFSQFLNAIKRFISQL